ncbi:MAG: hypothetical protein ACREVR_06560, partial [Burkholderiales bacterium]
MNTRRRLLISLGAGAFADALPAFAQQKSVHRLGWISADRSGGNSPFLEAFRDGMRKLDYVEGRNLIIDAHWGEGSNERIEQLAAELVKSKPDVIVTQGGAVRGVLRAGATMPVVFG